MSHHTKDKGDCGVGKVIAGLMDQGLKVAMPICEHLPFDLIAIDEKMELFRVQVKYKKVTKSGIEVSLRSCYSDKNGTHIKKVDKSRIDVFAIYCPCTNGVYYVPIKELSDVGTSFTLGFGVKNKRKANDYLRFDPRTLLQ
jgi:hypothetical protein